MRSYLLKGIMLLCGVFISSHAIAQYTFTGVFQAHDAEHQFLQVSNWEDLQSSYQKFKNEGFGLVNIEMAGQGPQQSYWTVFAKEQKESILKKTAKWENLLETDKALQIEGMNLVDIEAHRGSNGDLNFIGLWKPGEKKQQIWKLSSWAGVLKLTENMGKQNMFIQDIEVVELPGQKNHYILIFRNGTVNERTYFVVHQNWKTFITDQFRRNKSGYHMKNYLSLSIDGTPTWVGIFEKGNIKEQIKHNLTAASLQSHLEEMKEKGLSLTYLEVRYDIRSQEPVQTEAANHFLSVNR